MFKDFKPICVVLFILFTAFQQIYAQHLTDILVNTEPDSYAFKATSTSLHVLSPEKFMVIWYEDRAGNKFAWAKTYDLNGNPLNDEFRVLGNGLVFPYNNDYYAIWSRTAIHYEYDSDWFDYIQQYQNNVPISEPILINEGGYGMCSWGDVGSGYQILKTFNGFLLFSNHGGTVKYSIHTNDIITEKMDWLSINRNDDSYYPLDNIEKFIVFPSIDNNNYFILYFTNSYWRAPPIINQMQLARFDIQSRTINPTTVITDTLVNTLNYTKLMDARHIDDNLIRILWANTDSLVELDVDTLGSIIQQNSYSLHDLMGENWDGSYQYCKLSNIQNNSPNLLLVNRVYKKNAIYDFDLLKLTLNNLKIHKIDDQIIHLNNWKSNPGNGDIYLNPENQLYLASTQNNIPAILKYSLNGIETINTIAIPNKGASQHTPDILITSNEKFCCTYLENNSKHAVQINFNGETTQYWKNIPDNDGLFFNNGQTFHEFIYNFKDDSYNLYMKIYNTQTWELEHEIKLHADDSRYQIAKLDSLHFIVFLRGDENIIIWKYIDTGELVSQLNIPCGNNSWTPVTVYPLTDGKYYINSDTFYLFSGNSMTYSPITFKEYYNNIWPVNDSHFIHIHTRFHFPDQRAFTIFDSSGIILETDKTFSSTNSIQPIQVLPIETGFILLFEQYNNFVFQFYNHQFEPYFSNLPIVFPDASPYIHDITMKKVNDNLVFACTDIRDNETGKNVYASIFNINDLITGIENSPQTRHLPAKFSLSAPSPNPSRSGQSITFQLDLHQQSKMEFKLYNILGQRIQTYNRQFNAGQQSVRFQLPNLAAGVYFLKATDNQQAIVKKIAVIR